MASLWLCCLLISVISITNHLSPLMALNADFGLQLPGNDTGCNGRPHGDPLHSLCDQSGMSCCLYTDHDECGPGMCLTVEGGDENSIGALFLQLPVDNITAFGMAAKMRNSLSINLRTAKVCLLSNLQYLSIMYLTPSHMDGINCLSQLSTFILYSDFSVGLTITNNTFRGHTHTSVLIHLPSLSLSAIGMMQLLHSTKESLRISLYARMDQLDVWPLCLAQKQQQLLVFLDYSRISDFQHTLSPALCNIEEAIDADVEISLRFNAISHISDIASGWGFDSLHHFINNLIRKNSTTFPIELEGNPFECDCRDLELYQMLKNPGYNMSLANLASLTCHHPRNLKGRRFDSLLDSELNCNSPSLPLILGVSIGGAVVLAVSLVGFLFYNRIRLYRWSGYKLHPWDLDECDGEDKEFDVFVMFPMPRKMNNGLWVLLRNWKHLASKFSSTKGISRRECP